VLSPFVEKHHLKTAAIWNDLKNSFFGPKIPTSIHKVQFHHTKTLFWTECDQMDGKTQNVRNNVQITFVEKHHLKTTATWNVLINSFFGPKITTSIHKVQFHHTKTFVWTECDQMDGKTWNVRNNVQITFVEKHHLKTTAI